MTEQPERQARISFLFSLFAIHHRVRTLLVQTMSGVPLRPDEYAVYSAVLQAGPLTISSLAKLCGMPLTTVSDYVRTMTERGHARRDRNPQDSRSYLIALTGTGVEAQRASKVAFRETLDRVRAALPIPESDLWRALDALDTAVRHALAEAPRRGSDHA